MKTNVPHQDSSDQKTAHDLTPAVPVRRRIVAPALIAGGIGLILMGGNALAAFVTSTVGTGSAIDPTATPALDQVFSPNDNAAPTFADTMSALYTCLVNSQTCSANQRTAAIDTNNDGVLSNAEILAALYLMLRGYRIIAWRYKTKIGEVDLIARRRQSLVFVEVKARQELSTALESVTVQMRKRITAAANSFLIKHPQYQNYSLNH